MEEVAYLILMNLSLAYILIKGWSKFLKATTESIVETKKLLREFRGLIVEVKKTFKRK